MAGSRWFLFTFIFVRRANFSDLGRLNYSHERTTDPTTKKIKRTFFVL